MAVMYTVTAQRVGRWWALQCEEVPGALSQVARLDQADQIREAIAFVADVPIESVEIDVQPVLPQEYREHLASAERLRSEAAQAQAQASRESRSAARVLHDAGLSSRDVGTVLGVSYQRAHQLIAG